MQDNFTLLEKIKYKLIGRYYMRIEFRGGNLARDDICSIFGVIKYLHKYKNKARIIID